MKKSPRLLRIDEVMSRVGFRRNKLYDLINEGSFPRPVKIGPISAWVEDEVDQWVADRIAERDGVEKSGNRRRSPEPAHAQ